MVETKEVLQLVASKAAHKVANLAVRAVEVILVASRVDSNSEGRRAVNLDKKADSGKAAKAVKGSKANGRAARRVNSNSEGRRAVNLDKKADSGKAAKAVKGSKANGRAARRVVKEMMKSA
ncbi:MAG: hypothetical protein AAB633_01035 [Patescibacteria group bacterium]